MPVKKTFCLAIVFILGLLGCRKSLLNEKPSSEIFVPTTLEDFQAILDNNAVMNITPALGETSSDDYYVHDTMWNIRFTRQERNAYVWADEIYDGLEGVKDWNISYEQVFYANVVLENIQKIAITPNNQQQWNLMMGFALFVRGYAFYNLAQVFCRVYDSAYIDEKNTGLPLRLSSDVKLKVDRSTLRQTYDQMIADLTASVKFLPPNISYEYRTRPNKPAAYAVLSRVYLSLRRYPEAGLYADSCLQLYNTLMNYNDPSILTPSSPNVSFSKQNAESMYYSVMDPEAKPTLAFLYKANYVDTNLYKMYSTDDLRRTILYTVAAKPIFRPTYSGTIFKFSGPATDEVFLTRAECYARAGRVGNAISDLNKLLENRYKTGTFTPYSTSMSQQDAVALILRERRKELPSRGRWTDIRRLNKEGANITLRRVVNNMTYTLPANDLRFVLPIPYDVQQLGKIADNIRK